MIAPLTFGRGTGSSSSSSMPRSGESQDESTGLPCDSDSHTRHTHITSTLHCQSICCHQAIAHWAAACTCACMHTNTHTHPPPPPPRPHTHAHVHTHNTFNHSLDCVGGLCYVYFHIENFTIRTLKLDGRHAGGEEGRWKGDANVNGHGKWRTGDRHGRNGCELRSKRGGLT